METLGVNERLARENPKSINFEKQLADNQYAIGVLKHVTGRFSEASEFYKKAIDTRQRLCANFPTTPGFKSTSRRAAKTWDSF